jgi:hypothetical protein
VDSKYKQKKWIFKFQPIYIAEEIRDKDYFDNFNNKFLNKVKSLEKKSIKFLHTIFMVFDVHKQWWNYIKNKL